MYVGLKLRQCFLGIAAGIGLVYEDMGVKMDARGHVGSFSVIGQRLRSAIAPAASHARARRIGKRGAVAMEFALLAMPLFLFFLGIFEVTYDLFVQEELDSAVEHAARSVQVGNQVGTNGETGGNFAKADVCPALTGGLSCSNLTVAVSPISTTPTANYYNTPAPTFTQGAGNCVDTGVGGQMMILAAWYDGPTFLGTLIPGFALIGINGTLAHRTYASAGFVDEYFAGGQSVGKTC